MKKKFLGIALTLAVLASLLIGSTVLAADPIVSVTATTPNGELIVTVTGIDTSTFHPGEIGQVDIFTASGGFTADFSVSAGVRGGLYSTVNAEGAYGTGATFQFISCQDFDVLVANHNHGVEGTFQAVATSTTNVVAMNMKDAGTMYVWSEATNPYSAPVLLGQYILKSSVLEQNDILQAFLVASVETTGVATMNNSNIWGWGIYENGSLSTNYNGGTRDVLAVGDGAFVLQGYGVDDLNVTGSITTGGSTVTTTYPAPGGGAITLIMNFLDSMVGAYSMNGN